jgi:hypothetical protein
MIIIITLILALIFLPWPWDLVAILAAAVFEVSLAVFGIGYSRRRRAQVGVQTMRANVRRTVLHEIAHHFGISDERLRELDRY